MKRAFVVLLALVFVFLSHMQSFAGEPMKELKVTVDKVIRILKDPVLKKPDKKELRKRLLRDAISERFDFEEMAKRALARHWRKRTPEERKEFVRLFRGLLERTYLRRIEQYRDERIIYKDERIEPPYALVKTVVITSQSAEIPIEYRMIKEGNDWKVYDVTIEGVSLVNNYRRQFNRIIRSSSYEELVRRLKRKVG